MLICKICGYSHPVMISSSHIKTHGITPAEYKAKFPVEVLRIQTAESRQKMSATKKSKCGVAWNFGIKTGKNEKLSAAVRGLPRPHLKGRTRTNEQRLKISESTRIAMVGKMTDAVRSKIRNSVLARKQQGVYVAPMH